MSKLLLNQVLLHLNNINLRLTPKVDPFSSSPVVSSSLSSSSCGEILDSSNHKAKNKKKRTKKKKQNKQGSNQANIFANETNVEKPPNKPRKVKFPCMLCKCYHLLKDFPSIP